LDHDACKNIMLLPLRQNSPSSDVSGLFDPVCCRRTRRWRLSGRLCSKVRSPLKRESDAPFMMSQTLPYQVELHPSFSQPCLIGCHATLYEILRYLSDSLFLHFKFIFRITCFDRQPQSWARGPGAGTFQHTENRNGNQRSIDMSGYLIYYKEHLYFLKCCSSSAALSPLRPVCAQQQPPPAPLVLLLLLGPNA